jgi:hypothetical protein
MPGSCQFRKQSLIVHVTVSADALRQGLVAEVTSGGRVQAYA